MNRNLDANAAYHEVLSRAQGCLLGQLAGDSLGSLVEFQTAEQIARRYPSGVRELADGGTYDTIAGQPTDDSEMALMLARTLVERGAYDPDAAFAAYTSWLDSKPFDCGFTTSAALGGCPNLESQANGAMMRVSPLGIFGAGFDLEQVGEWARQDAGLTHPNPVCVQANELYVKAIALAISTGQEPDALYRQIVAWAQEKDIDPKLRKCVTDAEESPPADYVSQQGWVLIAFQNALWQLLHAESLEDGVVDTVMRGGDTDTNAAICGALLGAVYGRESVPEQWVEKLLTCRPSSDDRRVRNPRPECMWPCDALTLAEKLLSASGAWTLMSEQEGGQDNA